MRAFSFLLIVIFVGCTAAPVNNTADEALCTAAEAEGAEDADIAEACKDVVSGEDGLSWDEEISDFSVAPATAISGVTAEASSSEGKAISYSLDLESMTCDDASWDTAISVGSADGVLAGTPSASDSGDCTVAVLASDDESDISQSFTITVGSTGTPAPTFTSVTPATSGNDETKAVTIVGTGFQDGVTVTVDGNDCTSLSFVSATQLTCTVPANLSRVAAVDIVITNPDAKAVTATGAYNYTAPVVGADTSSIVAAPGWLPDNGTTTTTITVIVRSGGGTVMAAGKTVEISVDSANVTLSAGGAACGAQCLTATDNSDGTYTVEAATATAGTYSFSAVVKETSDISITDTVSVTANSSYTTISSNTTVTSASAGQNFLITSGTATFDSSTVGQTFGHIVISGGSITHTDNSGSLTQLNFNVSSLTMTGGAINVDGRGYMGDASWSTAGASSTSALASAGLNSGGNRFSGGGSHGGRGGDRTVYTSGGTFDDFRDPKYPGGGAGLTTYDGGGVVRIISTGVCHIDSPAIITADGEARGGAGGTINLQCAGFAGSAGTGAVAANGGAAFDDADDDFYAGGGGGRVALISSGDESSFQGSFGWPSSSAALTSLIDVVNAFGGAGMNASGNGAAGTIYLESSDSTYGTLIIDNDGTTHNATYGGVTEFVNTDENTSKLFTDTSSSVADVTNGGTPFSNLNDQFAGSTLHFWPDSSALEDPLDAGRTSVEISANGDNSLTITTADFPTITDDHSYRFVYRLDELHLEGNAQVDLLNADLILENCDIASEDDETISVPAGSSLTGKSLGSGNCLDANVSTKASTVNFDNYHLQ